MSTTTDSRSGTIAEVLRRLATAQKSNRGAPGYSRWVNRPAGRLLAALAFRIGMSPNQVTALSAIFSFSAIALLALIRPTVSFGIGIAVVLMLAYALDSADGQLARLLKVGSPMGEWLDHVVDCTKSSAIHLAVLVCWFRFFDIQQDILLIVPLIFCLQSAIWFFTIILTEQLRTSSFGTSSKSRANANEAAPILRSLVVIPLDYGVLCISFALLGIPDAFVWLYSILMVINTLFLLAALPRWYASLRPTCVPPVNSDISSSANGLN